MDKYEYHKLDISPSNKELINELNKLGAQGWQLCAVAGLMIYRADLVSYYFHRKIESTI